MFETTFCSYVFVVDKPVEVVVSTTVLLTVTVVVCGGREGVVQARAESTDFEVVAFVAIDATKDVFVTVIVAGHVVPAACASPTTSRAAASQMRRRCMAIMLLARTARSWPFSLSRTSPISLQRILGLVGCTRRRIAVLLKAPRCVEKVVTGLRGCEMAWVSRDGVQLARLYPSGLR